jgi:hypothetical protein
MESRYRSKYGNKITYCDNIRFASKKEARRYQSLKLLLKAKKISRLELQPRYDFPMGFFYKADFAYLENGKRISEDVKGVKTPVFRLKRKCFIYFFPDIELRLT